MNSWFITKCLILCDQTEISKDIFSSQIDQFFVQEIRYNGDANTIDWHIIFAISVWFPGIAEGADGREERGEGPETVEVLIQPGAASTTAAFPGSGLSSLLQSGISIKQIIHYT